ncbi:MAG: hypothetical protein K6T74_13255 [Geminicoccaceae bacterium]|nr:hypothetical protein [Geminicoccaceae bacterium]
MSEPVREHRLEGLEPANPLAFLALLGLLRALEEVDAGKADDERWWPRAFWAVDSGAWQPVLRLAAQVDRGSLCGRIVDGIRAFGEAYALSSRAVPDFPLAEYRGLADTALDAGPSADRRRLDVLAAVATDQKENNAKDRTGKVTARTPLCFAAGNEDFLPRLEELVRTANDGQNIECALFGRWQRRGKKRYSFRWDPEEAARQALMAGDPTDDRYRLGSETGANRLAVIGLSTLPVLRDPASGDTVVPGGARADREIALHWPIWTEPASLAAIRALLVHPRLVQSDRERTETLGHLGVVGVYRAGVVRLGNYGSILPGRLV